MNTMSKLNIFIIQQYQLASLLSQWTTVPIIPKIPDPPIPPPWPDEPILPILPIY